MKRILGLVCVLTGICFFNSTFAKPTATTNENVYQVVQPAVIVPTEAGTQVKIDPFSKKNCANAAAAYVTALRYFSAKLRTLRCAEPVVPNDRSAFATEDDYIRYIANLNASATSLASIEAEYWHELGVPKGDIENASVENLARELYFAERDSCLCNQNVQLRPAEISCNRYLR